MKNPIDNIYENTTEEERDLIHSIVGRVADNFTGGRFDRLSSILDLMVAHTCGCPLKLAEMAADDADSFSVSHDVYGIARHLDHNTGVLGDCFRPRYAA